MIINIIYIVVGLILIFLIYISIKAIFRGLEAKQKLNKYNKSKKNSDYFSENASIKISEEILKTKKLYDKGILTKDEFKKAKEKILNS